MVDHVVDCTKRYCPNTFVGSGCKPARGGTRAIGVKLSLIRLVPKLQLGNGIAIKALLLVRKRTLPKK